MGLHLFILHRNYCCCQYENKYAVKQFCLIIRGRAFCFVAVLYPLPRQPSFGVKGSKLEFERCYRWGGGRLDCSCFKLVYIFI